MDPNETLSRMRRVVGLAQGKELDADAATDALDELAELADALDGWVTGGGFLPDAWAGRQ